MRKILMVGTGGTIASVKSAEGLTPGLSVEDLLKQLPEVAGICHPEVEEAFSLDSTDLQPKQWECVAHIIEEKYSCYDGFVVCHGTDTLAYGAAALSVLIQRSPKPIVVTGSQLSIEAVGSDAPKNLLDSFRYAADPKSQGVVVVFDGSVIQGDRARKQRTREFHAFESINAPELARIENGKIIRYTETVYQNQEPRFFHRLAPDAAIVKLYPGMPGEILESYFRFCRGLIIEGFGMGGLPSYLMETFHTCMERYKNQCKVVLATQVPWDGTDITCYEVGRRVADPFPVAECGDMTAEAALMKLMWLLGLEEDEESKDWRKEFRSEIQ